MAIRCPYCMFEMELKGARPGRFTPRCAGCGEKFSLLIPENPKVSPTVSRPDEVLESFATVASAFSMAGWRAHPTITARSRPTTATLANLPQSISVPRDIPNGTTFANGMNLRIKNLEAVCDSSHVVIARSNTVLSSTTLADRLPIR